MKKTFFILCVVTLYFSLPSHAQFFDKIKNKVNQKVNDAIDRAGKKKTKTDTTAAKPVDSSATRTTDPGANSTTGTSTGSAGTGTGAAPQSEDIKSYSKFDFVPGEKIIVAEDFSQDNIGEFPGKWNTKTSAEVVTLNNRPGKWLCMKQDGEFYPEYIPELPDNFTFQVDMITNNDVSNIASLIVGLGATRDATEKFDLVHNTNSPGYPHMKFNLTPESSGDGSFSYSTSALGSTTVGHLPEFHVKTSNFATLSIWRQKQRVRVYVNSTKMLDLPKALEPGMLINTLAFGAYAVDYDKKGGAFYISNIRIAIGAPDTRNKLINEGKFVTHGILFDVSSDKIKPQSYGALQDIAKTLTENPTIKVRIVGHTDSDGEDAANLTLSTKRAEAVKAALIASFSIDAARMTTEGKGETQPIDNNTTLEGKANNRRVEFVKL